MHILTKYRKATGISQHAFAAKVSVDQSIISRIEAGPTRPGLALAFRIEEATEGAVPASCWANAGDMPPKPAPQTQTRAAQ